MSYYKNIFILVILTALVIAILYIKKMNNENKVENDKLRQRIEALKDSTNETFYIDTLFKDTLIVIKYLRPKIETKIEGGANFEIEENNYVKVEIDDKWEEGWVKGFTYYSFITDSAIKSLIVSRDPIEFTNKIFFDKNGILKSQIFGDSVQLFAKCIIDENVYDRLKNPGIEKETFIDRLKLIPKLYIDNKYKVGVSAEIGYYDNYSIFIRANNIKQLELGCSFNLDYKFIKRNL